MNPVLLKPGSDRRSHVVRDGAAGRRRSTPGTSPAGARQLAEAAFAAYDDLAARFDVVVVRGRGQPGRDQPARGRLRQHGPGPARRTARWWSSATSTAAGCSPRCSARVALLDAGRPGAGRRLRGQQVPRRRVAARARPRRARARSPGGRCSACCRGARTLWLDSEDALDARTGAARPGRRDPLRVAVVRLPRISNFTDVDALGLEPGVDVRLRRPTRARWPTPTWSCCPAPGRPSSDLAWLRGRGASTGAVVGARRGRAAGARHLRRLPDARPRDRDPDGVEGRAGDGSRARAARRDHGQFARREGAAAAAGHGAGRAGRPATRSTTARVTGGGGRGVPRRGRRRVSVFGTMWHGSLECDGFRDGVPRRGGGARGPRPRTSRRQLRAAREARLDHLADLSRSMSTSMRCSA